MPIPTPVFTRLPGTPATPQFAEYVLDARITESDATTQANLNILHFFRSGGPGTASENDLGIAIALIMAGGSWTACFNGDVNNVGRSIRFMDDPTRLAVAVGPWGAGTVAGSRSPSFVSAVSRKRGFARGRQYRGSIHWGPPPESFYDKDQLNGAGLAAFGALNATLSALCTPFVSGGVDTWQLCILSTSYCDFSVNPSIFTGTLAKDTLLNTKIGTMKRRKQNIGI